MTHRAMRSSMWQRAGRVVAATVAALAITASGAREADAIPLIRGLGGPADFGRNELHYNDDESSSVINVAGAFPFGLTFFGRTFRDLYVNNNGNITFGGSLSTYTPAAFPVANQRMIAPWWGDVDTRGMGRPARNGVYWDIRPGQFTVTWYLVGYFNANDDLQNSFQMILRPAPSCGSGDFDVEFRYERCQWTTGDASGGTNGFGGTPAQAGFDAGDRVNFFALPGSRMMSILNLCTTSNVGEPGRWLFQIRGGELPCLGSGDPCSTGLYGACARGTVQCRSGRPFCAPDNIPRVERCDGVDNDCDGMTDEGDRMAPPEVPPRDPDAGAWMPDASSSDASSDGSMSLPDAMGGSDDAAMAADAAADSGVVIPQICARNGDVCVAGNCVPGCVEGACFGDQTCTAQNVCVETSCLNVNCPEGQTCRGGMCVDPCAGVTCPSPTTCRFGICQDLCQGVTCESLQVCREGRCVAGCQCVGCAAGEVCQMDGRCIPQLCVGAMCDTGDLCDSRGRCVNPCEGATCPAGQMCDRAQRRCVDTAPPGPEPTVDSGVLPPPEDSGALTDDGGMTGMDASATDAGGGGGFRRPGCACRAPASAPNGNGGLALFAVMAGAAVVAGRRSRRARR